MNFNHQILSKRHKECNKTIPFEEKTINYWQVHSWANDLKLKMNGGKRTALLLNLLVLLYCDFALLLIQCGRWGRMNTVLSLLSEHERNLVQLKKRLSRWSWITHLRRPRNRKSIEFVSSRVHLNTMWIEMGSVNLPAAITWSKFPSPNESWFSRFVRPTIQESDHSIPRLSHTFSSWLNGNENPFVFFLSFVLLCCNFWCPFEYFFRDTIRYSRGCILLRMFV